MLCPPLSRRSGRDSCCARLVEARNVGSQAPDSVYTTKDVLAAATKQTASGHWALLLLSRFGKAVALHSPAKMQRGRVQEDTIPITVVSVVFSESWRCCRYCCSNG